MTVSATVERHQFVAWINTIDSKRYFPIQVCGEFTSRVCEWLGLYGNVN